MSRSPTELTTKRLASDSACNSGTRLPAGDPVFQATSGLGVPTTLHVRFADCVSEILTLGGGERMKLGASAE